MKRIIYFLSISLTCLITLFSTNASATHSAGGEVTWRCVSKNGRSYYVFKLVVYRDCTGATIGTGPEQLEAFLNGQKLSTAANGIKINNGGANTQIIMRYVSSTDISPDCNYNGGNPLSCANRNKGALEKFVWLSDSIDFTGINPPVDILNPFVFMWSLCCRNGGIANIPNYRDSGSLTYFTVSKMFPFYPNGFTTPQSVENCFDSAPDFSEPPTALVYATGVDYTFNSNAIDYDLDNLYYELADPIINASDVPVASTPIDEIWKNYPQHSTLMPFGPQASQRFNNLTGEITIVPTSIGQYASVIKVSSYKCDQKVSEIYRDFQIYIEPPTVGQNTNRFPTFYHPFARQTRSDTSIIAGNALYIPIIVRDSLPGINSALTDQELEITVNGIAMGEENASTTQGCPYPPCAKLVRNLSDLDYNLVGNEKPVSIANVPGEIFGYGYKLPQYYNGNIWLYWPTSCSNLDKASNACNGLTSSIYNFVVTTKDNFCQVPGKTIRSFSVNVLPPDFYLSPPIRCISYDDVTGNINLQWGYSTGDRSTFVRYEIYRGLDLIHTDTDIDLLSFTDMAPNASPDSLYYVRAINLCNVMDEVNPVKVMRIHPDFYRNNQARLTWNPIRNPNLSTGSTYTVFRSQSRDPFVWEVVNDGDGVNTNAAAIDNFDLCEDTTYYKVHYEDNLTCTSVSMIDSIVHEKFILTVKHDTVCQGDLTEILISQLSGGAPPYSNVRWRGDEGLVAGNEDTVRYIFPSHGKKEFILTVTDSKGCQIVYTDSAFVRQRPVFDMTADSTCPFGVIHMGIDLFTDIPIDSIHWEYDQDPSDPNVYTTEVKGLFSDPTIRNIKHIFVANSGVGKFPVRITLKDMYGCVTTIVDTAETGAPYAEILATPNDCLSTMEEDSLRFQPYFLGKPYNTVQWIDNSNQSIIHEGEVLPLYKLRGRRYIDLLLKIEDRSGCQGIANASFRLQPHFKFNPDSLCIGEPANFNLSFAPNSDSANFTYLWELDANTISTDRYPIHTYSSEGPKYITLTVTDIINNCERIVRDTLTVRQPMQYSVNVIAGCPGTPTVFEILNTTGTPVDWVWEFNDYPDVIPNNTQRDSTANPIINFAVTPVYYKVKVKVKDQITGCWTPLDTIIKVFNVPDIDFHVDSMNCSGKLTQFISKVVGNSGPYIYDWIGDAGFVSNEINPTHMYPDDDDKEYYNVTLNVMNNAGCITSLTKNVHVCNDKRTLVQVPQIFSPGRERNNTLSVSYLNVDNFEIRIYNRWGIEVFESIDPKFVWDGKDKSGDYLIPGTYVYIVKANGKGKRNYLTKGTIAVLR